MVEEGCGRDVDDIVLNCREVRTVEVDGELEIRRIGGLKGDAQKLERKLEAGRVG